MIRHCNALFLVLSIAVGTHAQAVFTSTPEVVHPYLVSTDHADVKLTFSADGKRMLWGVIGREAEGHGGWDIWESTLENGRWSIAAPATFNSDSNDFDPFFAPDGTGVYFFSNRAGGLGGDDLYFAPYNTLTQQYGDAANLGITVNSPGDEWGPVVSADGKQLMFCTDGRGGIGKHDIFIATRRGNGWAEARHTGKILNSVGDDFDPVWLDDGRTIVFASERNTEVDLYTTYRVKNNVYSPPKRCEISTPGQWDFGCAVDYKHPGVLYFSAHREDHNLGRSDIYRVFYTLSPP